jgi:hypothetical protein
LKYLKFNNIILSVGFFIELKLWLYS